MLARLTVRASDVEASARFYATLLDPLGLELRATAGGFACEEFALAPATTDAPATSGLHLAFGAPSRAHVDAAWRAGTAAGHPDDGEPGPRAQYGADYYGGFLRDPDANSAEAVHHGSVRAPGAVDHLWIRVADVAAARDFYAALAPHAGLRRGSDSAQRAQFVGAGGSFSLVAGSPVTEHVALAFTAAPGAEPGLVGRVRRDPDGNEVTLG